MSNAALSPLSVVTLDGPAGVGKTTLARNVADSLCIPYLDTGAMFRCLALKLGADVTALADDELRRRCAGWTFSIHGTGSRTALHCNGVAVGEEIRTEQVGMLAAKMATVPLVREILKLAQRGMSASSPLVVEGRDMGTVVFPQAKFKFFLDATPDIRALRRLRDLETRGEHPDLAALTEQIRARDALDRNRPVAPLRPADDAVVVDTSQMDIAGVQEVIIRHITAHGGLDCGK